MKNLVIRRFDKNDATDVSKIICGNFLEVNTKDYSKGEMEHLSGIYNSDKL